MMVVFIVAYCAVVLAREKNIPVSFVVNQFFLVKTKRLVIGLVPTNSEQELNITWVVQEIKLNRNKL